MMKYNVDEDEHEKTAAGKGRITTDAELAKARPEITKAGALHPGARVTLGKKTTAVAKEGK